MFWWVSLEIDRYRSHVDVVLTQHFWSVYYSLSFFPLRVFGYNEWYIQINSGHLLWSLFCLALLLYIQIQYILYTAILLSSSSSLHYYILSYLYSLSLWNLIPLYYILLFITVFTSVTTPNFICLGFSYMDFSAKNILSLFFSNINLYN